ncbi:unnamed protein product [Vitrella brassicaformis CCMP3155]|uniref:Uncharacterized protein n=2 Tax=Vitrella brassicaformis TaxID=1169539 RepID=A0A0G4GIK8_VITBC|nr:unnamed protein product [Vitrella brassicaformis CCMP3155]|eukprot:CEM29671.1 unnamed protein product [Vitrella brassicaformis CCMP3155]
MAKRVCTEDALAASSAASHTSQSRFPDVLGEAGIVLADFTTAPDLYAFRRTSRAATHQLSANYLVQRISRCSPTSSRVRPADVQRVGSKAVLDGRADSLKQYSLFGHLLGQHEVIALRQIDGIEQLGETLVTVYTQQTLPVNHEFIGSFDPTDPVVRANNEVDYMSFRQLAITRFPSQERRMCYRSIRQGLYAQFRHMLRRAADLLTQAAIPWGRQIRLVRVDHGRRSGSIYLCGEGKDDTFAACVTLRSRDDRCCTIDLYTTETPQPHQEGPLRFPQTLQLARQLLGNDEQTLFGDLAIQVRAFGPLPRKVMALMAAGMTKAQAWATVAP